MFLFSFFTFGISVLLFVFVGILVYNARCRSVILKDGGTTGQTTGHTPVALITIARRCPYCAVVCPVVPSSFSMTVGDN